jgi:hypothetical protein
MRSEGAHHRSPAFGRATASLRTGGDRPPEERPGRNPRRPSDAGSENLRLVESTLGEAPSSQRHPCHDIGGGPIVHRRHR